MIADEVSHDVLAALLGGLALIIVATLPMLWRAIGTRRANEHADIIARLQRIENKIDRRG